MEMPFTVETLDGQSRKSLFSGVEFVRVAGEGAQLSHAWFTRGAVLPSPSQRTHQHDTEEMLYVRRGALRLWWGDGADESCIVRAGQVIVIPNNVPHGGEVLEDAETFGVNCPPRTDHANAGPAQT